MRPVSLSGGWCAIDFLREERSLGTGWKDLGSHEEGSLQPKVQALHRSGLTGF